MTTTRRLEDEPLHVLVMMLSLAVIVFPLAVLLRLVSPSVLEYILEPHHTTYRP